MKIFFRVILVSMIISSLFLSLSSAPHSVPMVWNDKLIHCISYFLLMMVLDFSYNASKQLLIKAVLILIYSGLIEYAQGFIPGRETSLADLLANGVGIMLFIALVPVLKQLKAYQFLKLI
ncbi:MAG: VanZ family protein [Gammaproteobacteria bacterium]